MNFDFNFDISLITVFVQGVISFFSPCVLPLIPLYLVYLSGSAAEAAEPAASVTEPAEGQSEPLSEPADGLTGPVPDTADVTESKGRSRLGRTLLNTLFFVFGIAGAFFLLGLGATALGRFFSSRQILMARVGGVLVMLFGFYQLGWLGNSRLLASEHRLPLRLDRLAMHPLTALLMGFAFSFAWTPCVGPTLASVLLMTASARTQASGILLIALYTLGFSLPFLAAALFSEKLTGLYRRHPGLLKNSTRIGGILLILMGLMMYTGTMNSVTGYLSGLGGGQQTVQEQPAEGQSGSETSQIGQTEEQSGIPEDAVPAVQFELVDQYGKTHTLDDYKGKIIFLNFWATWCPPCRQEMPHIQKLYEEFSADPDCDVQILAVAGPGQGSEKDISGVTEFLKENGYSFPVLMDEQYGLFSAYGISAIPTTFMIDKAGYIYGYASGALSEEIMRSIIDQTREGGFDIE